MNPYGLSKQKGHFSHIIKLFLQFLDADLKMNLVSFILTIKDSKIQNHYNFFCSTIH